jgi:hypothetical protein
MVLQVTVMVLCVYSISPNSLSGWRALPVGTFKHLIKNKSIHQASARLTLLGRNTQEMCGVFGVGGGVGGGTHKKSVATVSEDNYRSVSRLPHYL